MQSERRWILCVTDQESVLNAVYQSLPRHMFPVTWAKNSSEAREQLDRIRFDLVILDLANTKSAKEEDLEKTLELKFPLTPRIHISIFDTASTEPTSAAGKTIVMAFETIKEELRPTVEKLLAHAKADRGEFEAGLGGLSLERSGALLPLLFTTMNDGCLLVDGDGIVIAANEAVGQITGLDHEEALGRGISELFDRNTSTRLLEFIKDAAQSSESKSARLEGTVVIAEKAAEQHGRHAMISIRSHIGLMGRFKACALVITDIGELVDTRESLRLRVADLERFQRFFLDRERRVLELKTRIKTLEARLGIESPGLSLETRMELEKRIARKNEASA